MRALGVTGTDKGVSVDPKTSQTRVEGVFSAGSAVKKDLPILRSVQQAKAKAACISQALSSRAMVGIVDVYNHIMGRLQMCSASPPDSGASREGGEGGAASRHRSWGLGTRSWGSALLAGRRMCADYGIRWGGRTSQVRHRLRLMRMRGIATTDWARRGAGSQEGVRQAPLWSACREASPWSVSIPIAISISIAMGVRDWCKSHFR